MAAAKPAEAALLSAERQFLADAIEALRVADAAIAELQENDAIRTTHAYDCMEQIEAAETTLADTTRRLKQAFALAERSQWEPDPVAPPAMIEAVPEARRRYEEALAARDGVRAELRREESNRERLEARVQRAALGVIAAHAIDTGLVAEVDRKHREAFDAGLRLAWLDHHGLLDTANVDYQLPPVARTLWRVRDAADWGADMPDVDGARPYAQALSDLMTDATAEIGGHHD
jgi:hypothetical protein